MRALLLGMLVWVGCAEAGDGDRGTAIAAVDREAMAIAVRAGGVWARSLGCPSPDPATCHRETHAWVDLAIRNDAYDKRVGIVWIDVVRRDPADPTQWQTALAQYEGTSADGRETWGVDLVTGVVGGLEPDPRLQFAAFVEMAGETHWDNADGHDHHLPQ